MASQERSPTEQIRALIEEVDRVRSETERVTSHVDRSMKYPMWPDRRRFVRIPSNGIPSSGDEAA